MKRVAIIGASGYTGKEVARILEHHPDIQVESMMTARPDSDPPPPDLPIDIAIAPLDLDSLADVDGVFLCAPHGASATLAATALTKNCKVVDLSADFRLEDKDIYEQTYGLAHPCPELLEEAVYGLTEYARTQVAAARLVANPGCYPTSILLPLLPLLASGLIADDTPIIADSKSGVSGAGKKPTARSIFGSVHENFLAYGVGTHRHTPEIWQAAGTDRIRFVPHLLPVFRGILTTLYLTPADGITTGEIVECLDATYAMEPFIRVYDTGLPELNRVQHTNCCDIGVASVQDQIVVVSAIDNLVKGAAGQAIQNMNLMLGLDETTGLADS